MLVSSQKHVFDPMTEQNYSAFCTYEALSLSLSFFVLYLLKSDNKHRAHKIS